MKLFILLNLLFISLSRAQEWFPLGNWIEEEGTPDLAGHCVANSMDGKIIAVTAPHFVPDDEDGKNYGRVVVYKFDEERDAWDKLGSPIVGEEGEGLGWSLGMSEDGYTIVVGSINDYNGVTKAGSVRVFTLDRAGNPKWVLKGKVISPEQELEEFGYSVDINDGGEVIAVGSPGHDVVSNSQYLEEAGAVRVYKFLAGENKWDQVQAMMEGKVEQGRFGESLSLSAVGVLAIGSPYANEIGRVDVYHYNATDSSWKEGNEVPLNTGIADFSPKKGDRVGFSVAMSFDGSKLAVGVPRHSAGNTGGSKRRGAVLVFKHDKENDLWTTVGGLLTGRRAGDEFGTAVAMSDVGNEIAIGSPNSSGDEGDQTETGHITVYRYNGSNWIKMHLEIDGKTAFNNLGSSISLSGDGEQVMSGAPTEGYATVYHLASTQRPTSSPTLPPDVRPERKKAKGSKFVQVIAVIGFVSLMIFGGFKAVSHARNKRAMAAFEPTRNTDLEMTPHGVPTPPNNMGGNQISTGNEVI